MGQSRRRRQCKILVSTVTKKPQKTVIVGTVCSIGEDAINKLLIIFNEEIRKHDSAHGNGVTISKHEGSHVTLPESALHTTFAGSVSDIRHCVVRVPAPTFGDCPFSSLMLKNVTESLVVCGNVSGPAHVTNLERCVVVVASRQFRMHDCKNCDVYLHCSSRPIIERCEGISFAPLPETYVCFFFLFAIWPRIIVWLTTRQTTESQHGTNNKFDQVDDFNWLKAEQSPHWRILPTEERTKEAVWKDIVPDGKDISVDDILKATRVIR